MNKPYVLIKFQNMPRENDEKADCSMTSVLQCVRAEHESAQVAKKSHGVLEIKLVCIREFVTSYISGTQIL